MNLEGAVAVVTGGASGIGLATVEALVGRGARVEIWDVAPNAADVAADVGASAGHVDVTDSASVTAAARAAGSIDVLVNSAGTGSVGEVWDIPDEEWNRVLDVNLKGTFICLRAVARGMVAAGRGRIVNVASVSGLVPDPGMAAYCASKAAVIMLTKVAALDLAPHNVLVNAVSPGPVDTPLLGLGLSMPGMRERFEAIPIPRLGRPDEIASAIVFLLENDWMTGESLYIDGGTQLVGPLGPFEVVRKIMTGDAGA